MKIFLQPWWKIEYLKSFILMRFSPLYLKDFFKHDEVLKILTCWCGFHPGREGAPNLYNATRGAKITLAPPAHNVPPRYWHKHTLTHTQTPTHTHTHTHTHNATVTPAQRHSQIKKLTHTHTHTNSNTNRKPYTQTHAQSRRVKMENVAHCPTVIEEKENHSTRLFWE